MQLETANSVLMLAMVGDQTRAVACLDAIRSLCLLQLSVTIAVVVSARVICFFDPDWNEAKEKKCVIGKEQKIVTKSI